jgi:hypothetical protein
MEKVCQKKTFGRKQIRSIVVIPQTARQASEGNISKL